jgi:hypothetical protein
MMCTSTRTPSALRCLARCRCASVRPFAGSACAAPVVEASMLNTHSKSGHNGSDATPPLVVKQTHTGHRPPTASMSGLMCSWHAHLCV